MERRGQTLYVDSDFKDKVPEHGLCAQCSLFRLSNPAENCAIVNKLLRISRDENLICAMVACPQFEAR